VARCYTDFLDLLIADERDSAFGRRVEGIAVRYTSTLMKSEADKTALARSVLGFLRELTPQHAKSGRAGDDPGPVEAAVS